MRDALGNASEQVRELWLSLSLRQRLSVVGGAAGTTLLFGFLIFWGSKPTLVPLMTGLSLEDASEVTARLQEKQVSYELASSGTAVLVPSHAVHELRLALASDGLPKGSGVGFEIFDEPKLGGSRFAERVNYRRALEGELARTISELGPVRTARVHLVLPEKRLFRSDSKNARASVTVQLAAGRTLNQQQVQSVVHLVSSAVRNLEPTMVTVVDQRGNTLAKGGDTMAGMNSSLQYQREYEDHIERRVYDILERAVGSGRVQVTVNASMDFTQRETTDENYDPENFAVRSEKRQQEERSGTQSQNPRGVPGAAANLAGGQPGSATPQGSNRVVEAKEYELNKTVKREVQQTAVLSRLTVAVVMDLRDEVADDGTVNKKPWTADELGQFQKLVQSAVGFDGSRGDLVEIQSYPFNRVDATEGSPVPMWLSLLREFWRPAIFSIVLAVFGFVWLRRRRRQEGQELIASPIMLRELEARLEEEQKLQQQSSNKALPNPPNPKDAAVVLRNWISEGASRT